jgi:pyruvate,water dikinase
MAQTLRELGLDNIVLNNDPAEPLALVKDTPQAKPFIEQFESFLQRHGHRCPNEVEFLNPRWIEAPEQVIELIANYLRAGDSVNPIEAEIRQRQRRLETVVSVARKIGPLRRVIFLSILRRAQKALPIRDNSRYFVTKFIFPMRKVFAELGRRWAEKGWLSRADDIFFLTLSEVQKIVEAGTPSVVSKDLHTLVKNRRIAYEYWMTVAPPDAIGPDGTPIVEEEGEGNVLEGTAVSGGRVRGIARIVLDPREAAKLRAGEILVTQATDPGWTPVFPLVSGLVLEIGGQLSHGAIVAREYGIPAVVNVVGATRRIADEQTIVVDGTHGRVSLNGANG